MAKYLMNRRIIVATAMLIAVVAFSVQIFDRWVERTELPNLSIATSVTVLDRNGALLRAYTVADGRWRLPTSVKDVDPRFVDHIIAYEDKRFFRHQGVDTVAMMRAGGQAVWNGRIVSGGSTLTMQVARLLEGGGTGRWGPKVRQIRVALALERRLGKDEILNIYLKLAPYGGNLEGVRAASLSYFGKEPARLTAAQSALLVALPQSPEIRRPDKAVAQALAARNRVLKRLVAAGVLPKDEAEAAENEGIPSTRLGFPVLAAHMSDRVVRANRLANIHTTTIDKPLQQTLEKLAKTHAEAHSEEMSAAVIVMDHQTGEIRASVGSADFLDHRRQGFIDMTRAIRSPGSTLKPLIYGLAFQAGLAHPESLIEDRPTAFGTYAPQNFDSEFRGTMPVREALQQSRNIPAVSLLEAVGPSHLVAAMRRAGAKPQLPGSSQPGLAVALGGVGVSLYDLVSIYASLANGGSPVQPTETMVRTIDQTQHPAVLTPEAAWQVSDILTGVTGPQTAPKNDLAYKTGTSYGYRDAWAIGFDGQHVIGVWMGRPDGASMPGILGADQAAPLLFEAFGRLKPRLDPLPPPPPSTLIVAHSDLPQPLQRVRGRNDIFETSQNGPEITFPPDGARVDLGLTQGNPMPLVLKIRNGTPPFTWIADGIPFLIASRARMVELTPDGPGHLNISVIDSAGQSKRAQVDVE